MITEFQGEYRWLSNFTPVQISLDGVDYPSIEHAYQSAKSESLAWKAYCANPNHTAGQVKRQSRTIEGFDEEIWERTKIDIMFLCLWQKYNVEPFKTKLLNTGDEKIQERNSWGDTFWGIDKRSVEGRNVLGRLLMLIRRGLRSEMSINDMVAEVRGLY